MVSINIKECLKTIKKDNPDRNMKEVEEALKAAVLSKKNGAKCIVCGNPIWAVGSALCGSNMCFSCITGESDSREDYEIDEVNN